MKNYPARESPDCCLQEIADRSMAQFARLLALQQFIRDVIRVEKLP